MKEKLENKIEIYINQDINNPKYLFHGSSKKIDKLVPKLSHDSSNNNNNIATAIFMFPSLLKATPYAFKDIIKEKNKDKNWSFHIPNDNSYPLMIMENVVIDESIKGYIYVFEIDNSMIKDENSYQYKCYEEKTPIDIIEVYYKDYEEFYEVKNENRRINVKSK